MPGTFVNYHYSRVSQGHGLIRGHVDLIPKVMNEFHPQKRPEVADRPLQGRIRPRSAPGGSRQEKSANHQKSKRSELSKTHSTSQFETAGPTEDEFDELGRRLDIARKEARSAWDEIVVLRRETEDLHDDCYELEEQASAMCEEQQRIQQKIEDANRQADTLVRKGSSVRKQMPILQGAPRSTAKLHKTAHKVESAQGSTSIKVRRSSKVSGSIHVAQLRKYLASVQEQLKSLRAKELLCKGSFSPRSVDAMTIAAKSWDGVKAEHDEEIKQLSAQYAVRTNTLDFTKQESSTFQKMMSKRMTIAMEDKSKIMEFTSNTAIINEELREQEDLEDSYSTEFNDLSMQVKELEQSNSELKCLQDELETQTRNCQNRWQKSTTTVQYEEASIVRHRRFAGMEEAECQQLQGEISNCELSEAKAHQQAQCRRRHTLQHEEALVRVAAESEVWEQKRIGLEEQCQAMLLEEQEVNNRVKSEASAALTRLASHLEGHWRSELDERERILAELTAAAS